MTEEQRLLCAFIEGYEIGHVTERDRTKKEIGDLALDFTKRLLLPGSVVVSFK